MPIARVPFVALLSSLALALSPLMAQSPQSPQSAQETPATPAAAEPAEAISISRAAGPIQVDGELEDPGWSGATPYDTFYETNPGDNVEPKVRTVAWLAYDDDYLYAAFEFFDPEPGNIRAPLADRDDVPSYTDYGGIILDTRNDGKTGFMFLVNPSNIQYDAISSDAGRRGPVARLLLGLGGPHQRRRVAAGDPRALLLPALRPGDAQTWGILLYRNYPRDFRYQMFSSKLPRGSNCFICHQKRLAGLAGLPGGNHLVLAPYGAGRRDSNPEGGVLGNPLEDDRLNGTPASTPSGHPTPTRPRPDDQPGLLAGRVRRGPDHGQRAVRPLLPREAAVLPGRGRPLLVPDPARSTRAPSPRRAGVRGAQGRSARTPCTRS